VSAKKPDPESPAPDEHPADAQQVAPPTPDEHPAEAQQVAPPTPDEHPAEAQQVAPPRPEPVRWLQVERFQRRVMAGVTVLLAVAYFTTIALTGSPTEPLMSAEAQAHFAYLPSMVIDRDLDLTNQFEAIGQGDDAGHPYGEAVDEYAANPHSIGPAILWMPGYLLGVLIDRSAEWFGLETGPDGYGIGALWGATLSSILLAGFGAELSRRVAAQLRGPEFALPATLIAWLGTAAITFTLTSPLHPQSAAWFCYGLTLWLVWRAFRSDSARPRWLLAGAAFGFLLGIDLQNAPLVLVPVTFTILGARDWVEVRRIGTAAAAGTFLGYIPSALVGIWLSVESPGDALAAAASWSSARLAETLFSPQLGWWVATPLVAIAIVGLVLKARRSRSSVARRVAWSSIVAIAALVILDTIAPGVPRDGLAGLRFVAATPLLILGLTQVVASIDQRPGLRKLGFALLLALVATNLWLLLA